MKKLIVRVKGGLGNQLFCYAAARRLAIANGAELVIDDVSGFVRDTQYRRQYALDKFSIPCRKATPYERLEPFERYRRGLAKALSKLKPFFQRTYLEEERVEFDSRLLELKINKTLYLDGLWQSEMYFKDIADVIRKELIIEPPQDPASMLLADRVRQSNSVSIHVRCFDLVGKDGQSLNLPHSYYSRAIKAIVDAVQDPHFFVFSDKPEIARQLVGLPDRGVTFVPHSNDSSVYSDLWLMTQCKHFIVANSTFSWWGAWLSGSPCKVVVAPETGFSNQDCIPAEWTKI